MNYDVWVLIFVSSRMRELPSRLRCPYETRYSIMEMHIRIGGTFVQRNPKDCTYTKADKSAA